MSNWTGQVGHYWRWCRVTRTAEIEAAELCRTFSFLVNHRCSHHLFLQNRVLSPVLSHIYGHNSGPPVATSFILIGTIWALIRPL